MTKIIVNTKHDNFDTLASLCPNSILFDITYQTKGRLVKLNPFYPYGDIPIPYTNGLKTATCVEAVWQGLMVFENKGIDESVFMAKTKKEIVRPTTNGKLVGFKRGPDGNDNLLYELEARKNIYFPTYRWMLENKAYDIIKWLRKISEKRTIVLLDDFINDNPGDVNKPISIAYLIKAYIEGLYPYEDVFEKKVTHNHICYGRHEYDLIKEENVLRPIIKEETSIELELPIDKY